MLDILKKLGLPSAVAALVAALVAIVPFLFKIDERYAKADELDSKIVTVSKQINDLTVEVGRLAGTQQVLVAVLASSSAGIREDIKTAARAPSSDSNPPVAAVNPAPVAAPVSVPEPAAAISTAPPKNLAEKKERLDQVSRELERSQRAVSAIQKY